MSNAQQDFLNQLTWKDIRPEFQAVHESLKPIANILEEADGVWNLIQMSETCYLGTFYKTLIRCYQLSSNFSICVKDIGGVPTFTSSFLVMGKHHEVVLTLPDSLLPGGEFLEGLLMHAHDTMLLHHALTSEAFEKYERVTEHDQCPPVS
jgi:hypothetical protein